MMPPDLASRLATLPTLERRGRVVAAMGTTIRATGLDVGIGDYCRITAADGRALAAAVVGIDGDAAILTPLGPLDGVAVGAVVQRAADAAVAAGAGLLGRVLDGMGQPIDGLGPLPAGLARHPLHSPPPDPMARPPIDRMLPTGIKVIDTLLSIGEGQRIGVFAAAGGGKSTLMGMLARHCRCDVIVIALIGERGREVREFIADCLGDAGLARSVIVCATADRPAMERVRAAHHATAIAEAFRAAGQSVLLLMDSATRFARALREIGLAAGEPAVRRGFPPSVFAELPRLFERTGRAGHGAITALYTVLLEDEEGSDPIGEEVRSLLDGHIVLSRKLGSEGHWPAVDVLASLSRLFTRLASPAHRAAATRLRALLAKHQEIAFLVQVGEYRPGSDPLADQALALKPDIDRLLRQDADEGHDSAAAIAQLRGVVQ
jgi:type III secretion protein N (ATPase)